MPAPASTRWTSAPFAAFAIILVALATRAVTFGNPVVIMDDQFYHYVGSAMLDGRWPYVNIWDRKPIGLFVLFAGIAAIGGSSVVAMQLVATLFAAATSFVIRHIALGFSSPRGALLAALIYLLMLPLFGGQSGQSPLFYNLLIASAAALLIGAARQPESRLIAYRACAAMLLCGLSLPIKQSSIVEGMFIGLAFLWLAWRRAVPHGRIALMAMLMVVTALLPSAIALAVYAVRGDQALEEYWFATYASIFLKQGHGFTARLAGIGYLLIYVFPLAIAAIAGAIIRSRARPTSSSHPVLAGWMIAALAGYLAIPNFFDHYALPLLPPLAVSAASLFALASGRLFFLGIAGFCLIQGSIVDLAGNRRERAKFERANAVIKEAAHGGCLFVANGPSRFYFTTPPCRSARHVFPEHLTTWVESGAIGVDQEAELARVLALRPAIIVMLDNSSSERGTKLDRLLYSTLERDYRSVLFLPEDDSGGLMQSLRVWQLRTLPRPSS